MLRLIRLGSCMRTDAKLFFITLLVYAVYVTPAGGTLPNRYVDLVHSIVNEGRFAIDTYHENTIDKAYYEGHYYVGALPGPSLFAVPAYLVFKGIYVVLPSNLKELAGGIQSYKKDKLQDSSFYGKVDNTEFFLSQTFLTLTVVAVASALSALILFKTVRFFGYGERIAVLVALLYAFGTNVFFYSTVFYDHVLSATLGLASFYLILLSARSARGDWVMALASGMVAGAALLVEYPNIFVAVFLGMWLLVKGGKRRLTFYAVGFAFPVLILMAYNWVSFNNPIATPYMYETEANRAFHVPGFFGVTYPHADRLISLLFSTERGLFLFLPVTIIGLLGIIHRLFSRKDISVAVFCGATAVSFFVFYSTYSVWDGGAAFGPRFLIPSLPFIMLGVAFASDVLPQWLVNVVGLLSVAVNWAGAQFGFAESPLEHIRDLFAQGPTLPVFGAILSHSTNQGSVPYLFAERYHGVATVAITIGLIGLILWAFRGMFWRSDIDSDAKLRTALAENR